MKHKYPVVGVKRAPRKSLAPFWGGVLAVMVLALVGAGPGSFNQAIVQAFGGPLNLRNAVAGEVPVKQADGSWAPGTAGGTIGGSLGSTDNVLLRSDGTGGVTAQGSAATLDDAELLDLTATGALALGTGGANDPRLIKSADGVMGVTNGTTPRDFTARILNAANGGAPAARMNGAIPSVAIGLGSTSKVVWTSTADASQTVDTALSRDAAGRVLVENGSGTAADLRLDQLLVGNGTQALPAITFGDADTGLWASGGTTFGISVNNSNRVAVDGTALYSTGVLDLPAGSASAVALRLNSDANTGLFGTANSSVSTAIGGTTIATVGTVGVTQRSYPEAITGNYTVTDAQSGQVFTNTGAGAGVEVELGSISATGISFTFVATDNQDVTLDPGSSDKFVGLAGGWADGEAMLIDDQNDAVKITRLSTGDWLVEWTRGTLTEETP